jgi:hypothetical protein
MSFGYMNFLTRARLLQNLTIYLKVGLQGMIMFHEEKTSTDLSGSTETCHGGSKTICK